MKIDLKDKLLNKMCIDEKGCWIWTNAPSSKGYGRLCHGGKIWLAHRLSYIAFKEPIPEGLFVCHSCDIPLCINPKHLWLGTQSDNMKDMASKGRSIKGKIPWNKGKIMPDEIRKRMSKPKSEEHKKKLSIVMTGKKRNPYKKKNK